MNELETLKAMAREQTLIYDANRWAKKKAEVLNSPSQKLKDQKTWEEIKSLRIKNRRQDKEYINRKLVFKAINEVKNKWIDTLRQKLEHELPSKCAGMNQIELKEVMTKMCDEMIYNFSKPIEALSKSEPPVDEDEENEAEPITTNI